MATGTPTGRQTVRLPAEVTSFVGRRHEAAEVKRMLSASRLVTLTGAGGVGKTRLALRVADEARRAFPDGVWLAELAELDNPSLLAQGVTEALEIRDHSSRPAMDVLVDHLRDRQALIVLDNCEHLLEECARLADRLLRAAPRLRLLTTSRQALGTAGEQSLAVPTLGLPDPRGHGPPRDARAVRRDTAVRRAGRGHRARLRARRGQPGRGRADLPPAGRHPAGHRARGRTAARPVRTAAAGAAGRPVPAAHHRLPDGPPPPSDAAGADRLEL
ncbi:ATP-binding protein [Streptomyces malaysiensis]